MVNRSNVADVFQVVVTQPSPGEPALEQEGRKGSFSGHGLSAGRVGIFGGFAKMSLKRKISFLTCGLWHELLLLVFIFHRNNILKFLKFSFINLRIFFYKWIYSECGFYIRSQETRRLLSYFPVQEGLFILNKEWLFNFSGDWLSGHLVYPWSLSYLVLPLSWIVPFRLWMEGDWAGRGLLCPDLLGLEVATAEIPDPQIYAVTRPCLSPPACTLVTGYGKIGGSFIGLCLSGRQCMGVGFENTLSRT